MAAEPSEVETIAANLKTANYPAMLLSPNRYRNRVIPPPSVWIGELTQGQVTTCNIAARTSLALKATSRRSSPLNSV